MNRLMSGLGLTRRTSLQMVAASFAVLSRNTARADGLPALSDDIAAEVARFAPTFVTRDKWLAKPPLPGMKPQIPTGIIIHHTAVPQNPKISLENKMRNLQSFSQQPGQVSPKVAKPAWPDVPYHYYVEASGRIAEGRDVHFAGDSNTRYDTVGYVQVVLEGDFETEIPAPGQLAVTRDLLASLMLCWNVPIDRISVHKGHAATTCPGRNLMALLPEVLARTAERRTVVLAELCRRGVSPEFARLYCQAR
jgi:N-acetylmuramoyl-L-alanine amidase